MSMDWFRWHHGTVNDPKWAVIARRASTTKASVIAVFAALLERASQNDIRGDVSGWDAEDVGAGLDIDVDVVHAIVAAMQGKVIDGNILTGWEKRQPKRERDAQDTSTERVKKHREAKKLSSQDGVSSDETPRNTTKHHETPRLDEIREDKRREDEKNKELERERAYAFDGRVIKLTQSDFDAWKEAYHAIDLRAALTKVDAWMVAKGRKDDWFFSVSKWLEKDHQIALQARKSSEPNASTIDALSAVLGASNRQTAVDLLNAAKTDEKALAVVEDARQSEDPVMFAMRFIGKQTTTKPELFMHLDPKYRPFTADFRQ